MYIYIYMYIYRRCQYPLAGESQRRAYTYSASRPQALGATHLKALNHLLSIRVTLSTQE